MNSSDQAPLTGPFRRIVLGILFGVVLLALSPTPSRGQDNGADREDDPLAEPSEETRAKVEALIGEVLEPEAIMPLDPRRSKLIRTRREVTRYSVTNPEVVEVVQFSPTEFELIGGQTGESTLTLWFGDDATLRYLVRVGRDETPEDRTEVEYGRLQQRINELFPNSMVQLIPIADKLIIRGQARDSKEASEILSIVSGQATDQTGAQLGPGSFLQLGTAAQPYPGATDLPATNLINLLEVPGEQQVMLKVRVAELTRSALREMGSDFIGTAGDFSFQSLLGTGGPVSVILDTEDVDLTMQALSSNGYSKILAEPNLVTLNGRPASFIAGGEFAVPTVVGIDGAAAATTSFRGFGTQVTFTPTIIDKDQIRLSVSPSFSTLNNAATVDGIPGLDTRAVTTTVDLRTGQWLALAGLIQDQQTGSKARVPYVGDLPVVGAVFSQREARREETELIILVSPELVHPNDAEEMPLILPGMDVTEPNDLDFFVLGRYEGRPHCRHRSTVWPIHRDRIVDAACRAMKEAKLHSQYRVSEGYYVNGPSGFSDP